MGVGVGKGTFVSSPFTTISGTIDLQNLALVQELHLAYSERKQADGSAAATPLVAGQDIQAVSLWSTWQQWVEDECNYSKPWRDYSQNGGDFSGMEWPPEMTVSIMRALAGLHADGFRRVAGESWPTDWTDNDDPAYSYGIIQAGDIIGPWLWVDLQRAFSTFRMRTLASAFIGSSRYYSKTSSASDATYATAAAAQDAAWPAGWSAGAAAFAASASVQGSYNVQGDRAKSEHDFSCPLTQCVNVDLYGSLGIAGGTGAYVDIDGFGDGEGNLHLFDSVASNAGTLHMGGTATNPHPLSGWTDSNPGYGGIEVAVSSLTALSVVTFDFTNQG